MMRYATNKCCVNICLLVSVTRVNRSLLFVLQKEGLKTNVLLTTLNKQTSKQTPYSSLCLRVGTYTIKRTFKRPFCFFLSFSLRVVSSFKHQAATVRGYLEHFFVRFQKERVGHR